MVLNDEISKELSGHPDILAINIYRFNKIEIGIDEEIDVDAIALKIAEEIKSRYTFYKVALPDNKKANVFMLEANFANINEVTILAPEDLLPTEMIQTQIQIQKLLEDEGFARKEEEDIEEFGGELPEALVLQDAEPEVIKDLEEIEAIFEKEISAVVTIPVAADADAEEKTEESK